MGPGMNKEKLRKLALKIKKSPRKKIKEKLRPIFYDINGKFLKISDFYSKYTY